MSPCGSKSGVIYEVTASLGVRVSRGELGEVDRPGEGPASFYRAHATELTRFATSLVGAGDAQDVVANAVAKTLAARPWASLENPRAYLFRAVYREAMSWRRLAARRRVRHAVEAERLSSVEPPIVEDLPSHDSSVVVALARLSARQRAVVVLTYWEDRPIDDVARLLGTSEGTVKKHLARARRSLRSMLGSDHPEDE
jgi:RNA polymerase sigma factor (sigma-70 family)